MNETTTMTSESSLSLVCGLEIHAELKTESKMFCSCQNDPFFAPAPNSYTCPVCLGMPGGLPVANKKAIEWTIKLGQALNCEISLFSKFDRKHYFYPDLAKGYQISQYDIPFCFNGYIETSQGRVRIRRIHLEEDTGKLQHKTVNGKKVSLIDFNRSGVPLVEIVTEPDIHSAEQAKEYGKKIRQILRYLDIADCDMEQGGMRLEANVSLSSDPTTLPNYKVEVKNINSFRFLEQAINFEIQRQGLVLMDGETPRQETRGWNSNDNVTFPQRSKEDAEDYRYFPDPDLPPIRFGNEQLAEWKASLPELPDQVAQRWSSQYKIDLRYSDQLAESQDSVKWVDQLATQATAAKIEVTKLVSALVNKKLNHKVGDSTETVISAYQATTQTDALDTNELDSVVSAVLAENPNEVTAYKSGKTGLINFFVGQVMRKLGKKVNVEEVKQHLSARLT